MSSLVVILKALIKNKNIINSFKFKKWFKIQYSLLCKTINIIHIIQISIYIHCMKINHLSGAEKNITNKKQIWIITTTLNVQLGFRLTAIIFSTRLSDFKTQFSNNQITIHNLIVLYSH